MDYAIKDKNSRDLTEAEIKKRWQEYTEELYQKDLDVPEVADLEPDILESKVKWALRSLANNKATGGDDIQFEIFEKRKKKVENGCCYSMQPDAE